MLKVTLEVMMCNLPKKPLSKKISTNLPGSSAIGRSHYLHVAMV